MGIRGHGAVDVIAGIADNPPPRQMRGRTADDPDELLNLSWRWRSAMEPRWSN